MTEFENLLSSDSDICRGRGGVMHIQENHGSNINMIPSDPDTFKPRCKAW